MWQDENCAVKYTDIDYSVFTDGAALVAKGGSPFDRDTYRYTPFLALLLTPNVFCHVAFGKTLFAVVDLAVAAQIVEILKLRRVPPAAATRCVCLWLLNPVVINVSTRGNAESLVTVLLFGALLSLIRQRELISAVLLATAIHLKLYPVIYVPAFLAALGSSFCKPARAPASTAPLSVLLAARGRFLAALCCTYGVLGASCLLWCGRRYLDEAVLHHLFRADARHNFSILFYPLYLAPAGSALRTALSLGCFVPQAALVAATAWRWGRDLPFCMLVQTLIFVSFNKVCTAQYFVWYLAFLPLTLPSSEMLLTRHRRRVATHVAAWILALLGWLATAYQLEFRGENVFRPLWAASLAFFAANVALICLVLELQVPSPLFRAGRLAPQRCVHDDVGPAGQQHTRTRRPVTRSQSTRTRTA